MRTRLNVKIADERGEPFMGEGPLQLLELIREHGSIRHAAKQIRLSYVKALTIINRMEKKLGKPVVVRKIGGQMGGGTHLTPFGITFLQRYKDFRDDVRRYADTKLHQSIPLPPRRKGGR